MANSGAAWWIEVGSEVVPLDGGWYWLEPVKMEDDRGMSFHAIRLVIDSNLAPDAWRRLASQSHGETSQLCCQLRSKTTQTAVRRLSGRLEPTSMVFAPEEWLPADAAERPSAGAAELG